MAFIKDPSLKQRTSEAPEQGQNDLDQGFFGNINRRVQATAENPLEAATGFVKGLGGSLFSTAKLAERLGNTPFVRGLRIDKRDIDIGEKPSFLEPKTEAEKFGSIGAEVAETILPIGLGKGKLALRVAKGSGFFGALSAKQAEDEGKSGKDVLMAGGLGALYGGFFPLAAKVTQKGFSPVTKFLPERLYQPVFRLASKDVEAGFRSAAKGKEIDPTLPREVLDRGLKGSLKNMAIHSIHRLNELEGQVKEFISKSPDKLVSTEGKKEAYVNLLKTVKDQFKSGFFPETAKEADGLIRELGKVKGEQISIELALRLRRFLDSRRLSSSFKNIQNPLAAKQEEFKAAAGLLRNGMREHLGTLMNEERIYIQAFEAIVDDAVRRGNRNLLNLTDVLIGGGGVATGFTGAGVGLAAAVRGFQQPTFMTNLGSLLNSLRQPPVVMETSVRAGLFEFLGRD